MSANDKSKFDRTAEYLAVKCQHALHTTKRHACATNIINNIIAAFTKNTRTGNCDILALQEATNWRLVFGGLHKHNIAHGSGFAELGYIHHLTRTDTGALAELCTLYNRRKFKLKSVATGDIGNGRPFQIIRLWWQAASREIIVINIHNSHHGSANILQAALSNIADQQQIITKIPANGCVDAGIWEPSTARNHITLPAQKQLKNSIANPKPAPLILFMGIQMTMANLNFGVDLFH